MKILKNVINLNLILLLTVFAACKKDQKLEAEKVSPPPGSGSYTFDNKLYNSTRIDYRGVKGASPATDQVTLYFYGEGAKDVVQFSFETTTGVPLEEIYHISHPGVEYGPAKRFTGSIRSADYSAGLVFTGGAFGIKKVDGEYQISFQCFTAGHGPVAGSYTGKIVSQ